MCFDQPIGFEQAIQQYSPQIQERLRTVLAEWASQSENIGDYIVTNIQQHENSLKQEAWDIFLNKILEYENILTNDHDPDEFETKYANTCYKDVFKDLEIFTNRVTVTRNINKKLGNAQDLGKFVKTFMKTDIKNRRAFNNDEETIKNFLAEKANCFDSEDRDQALAELQDYADLVIRKYNMWATWDLNSDNPFKFMLTDDPDEARLCLALGHREEETNDDPMLLITYSWDKQVYKPTVVDAGLHPYFKPSSESDLNYGKTNSEHSGLDILEQKLQQRHQANGYNRLSRPEGINQPITIGNLHYLKILAYYPR